jgi:hypothetical protein
MATKKLDSTGLSQVWGKIKDNFATKTNVETKAEKATSLSGYGIVDAYTKSETDNAIKTAVTGVYKFMGSVAFASLPTENLADGYVYNITDAFTTTDAFKEGAGKSYPAGTNVAYIASDSKWDCLAGIYDFSEYLKQSDIVDITSDEIDAICVIE